MRLLLLFASLVAFADEPESSTMRYCRVALADGIYDHVGSGTRNFATLRHALGSGGFRLDISPDVCDNNG